jgi:outer membrane protein assembly factor BamB
MNRLARATAVIALAVGLAACSSTDKPKPTPLENYTAKITARQVWSVRLGANVTFAMSVAARNGMFFAGANDGTVVALRADSGQEVWRAQAGAPLTAGVGSDGRYAAVVTRDNEVVALENGRVLWKVRVPSRVVTTPLVAGERVFVLAVDRTVHAFDVQDGRRIWLLSRPGESLTLAQGGVIAAYQNQLLVGQGVRLTAVDPLRGTVNWEVPLATPRGSNEVERLADLVGPPVRTGSRVCARAFQSAVGCADAGSGTLLWSRNVGGVNSIAADAERAYGADASDRVTAWSATNGDIAWTHERLLYRGLSGGVALGPSVVFGDVEGQLHFLSAASGETQLRLPTDGAPVVGTPVVFEGTLLVTTRSGGLHAFRPN